MSFTDTEIDYMASQDLGRLATVAPDGTVQVNPVGFTHNPEQVHTGAEHGGGTVGALIRIRPRRIISFGLDNPDLEPHQLVAHARDIA